MRLGFDGKRATRNFRGLGNYSRGLINGLLKYTNEELFLYTPPVKDQRALDWLNEHNDPRLHIQTPTSFIENKVPGLWRSFLMGGDLKRDKIDLYHGLSHEIPIGLKSLPIKSVVTIHDLIFMRYPEFFPIVDRLVYKEKFTYSSQNADLVIAICEQTKNDLINFLGIDEKKIAVHYQSCDPLFYDEVSELEKKSVKLKYSLSRPYILNVGAFEERKNQKNLILAYSRIEKSIEHDLVLIGAGKKYLEECKKMVFDLKLEDRVKFLTSIPLMELPAIYQMSSLFCFPSFFEGFGIPIIEALFSKVPVITSHGSCFPESAGPHSVFIDPHSIDEISEAIRRVLLTPSLYHQMILKGSDFAQQFHLENSTKKLMEYYRQLF